jgi:hypothetical protein
MRAVSARNTICRRIGATDHDLVRIALEDSDGL